MTNLGYLINFDINTPEFEKILNILNKMIENKDWHLIQSGLILIKKLISKSEDYM